VQALGTLRVIWGDILSQDARWLEAITRRLDDINHLGVLGALVKLQAGLDGK